MVSESAFEVEGETAFYGRTFEEYGRLFDLTVEDLLAGPVLDCPGGPGSFAAVAGSLGADVTAVDPEYGPAPDELRDRFESSLADVAAELERTRNGFVWDHYDDVETRVQYARAAGERFLADYRQRPGRYVQGALPELPFETDRFELSLSANFLFLYADRFDERFHVGALRELARVTAGEVRVFPLRNLAAEPSAHLPSVADALHDDGLAVERRSVPYEFQPDATEMLVVSGVAGYEGPD